MGRDYPGLGRRHQAAFLFAALCLLIVWPFTAKAQEQLFYTETEKIGFAFHRLTNIEPDFQSWIYESERYQTAPPVSKVEIMQEDLYRLKRGYLHYSPGKDLITLSLPVTINIIDFDPADQAGREPKPVKIDFTDAPDSYFPFLIGGVWVAMVLKDIDDITWLSLDETQYRNFMHKIKQNYGVIEESQNATVDIQLRPLSADTRQPFIRENLEMWLMMAEVGVMNLWLSPYGEKDVFWTYAAPWYVPPEQKELMGLFQK